jgi:hypothetical protein
MDSGTTGGAICSFVSSGGLFTELILDLIGMARAQDTVLHVEFRVLDRDGTVHEFKANGNGGDVLGALRAFEGKFQDESGARDS